MTKQFSKGRFAPALLVAFLAVAGAARADAPLYPSIGEAGADIKAALAQAGSEHKRVIVDFGANWCTDCKVLDTNFHKPENVAILAADFVVVHVNVGNDGISDNFDIASRYGVPLKKGVPALAVLDAGGKAVYAQGSGEFEDMRHMDPASVHEFLEKWKP